MSYIFSSFFVFCFVQGEVTGLTQILSFLDDFTVAQNIIDHEDNDDDDDAISSTFLGANFLHNTVDLFYSNRSVKSTTYLSNVLNPSSVRYAPLNGKCDAFGFESGSLYVTEAGGLFETNRRIWKFSFN